MGNGWEGSKQGQATEKQEGNGGVRKEAPVGLLGSWASCLGFWLWHQVHLGLSSGSAFIYLGSCLSSLSLGFSLCKELPPGVIVDGNREPKAFHLTLPT